MGCSPPEGEAVEAAADDFVPAILNLGDDEEDAGSVWRFFFFLRGGGGLGSIGFGFRVFLGLVGASVPGIWV